MGLTFDIETGHIHLNVAGPNGSIKRKDGKKIGLNSGDAPKLEDGDTVISGKNTKIQIDVSYNKGKEKPVDDYTFRASKTLVACPNSELQLKGFEKWDKTDAKTKERHYGESVKDVILKKGFFHLSIYNTDDPITTPVALIRFKGSGGGSGLFDVYDDMLYSYPIKSTSVGAIGIEYTNARTKQSFIAKSSTPEEIIVTRDAIYRKGLTNLDEIFQNSMQIVLSIQNMMVGAMPAIKADDMAKQMKNMGSTMEQSLAGLETLKQMSPSDLERLMKMGMEKSGQKITPEMMKQMQELPEMLKKMEDSGVMAKRKVATGKAKGFSEGMGNENIDKMTKMFANSMNESKGRMKGLTMVGDKDIDEILERPREYKPLTEKFGAVKVG